MAPILQLGLSVLDLSPFIAKQDLLFQVSASNQDPQPYCRTVPISETQTRPDWSLSSWKSSDMYYHFQGFKSEDNWQAPIDLDWYDGRVVGEYVRPSKQWEFSLGRELDEPPFNLIRTALDYLERLDIPQLSSSMYAGDNVYRGFFLGQMEAQRGGYWDFPERRTIYMLGSNASDYGEDELGLSIWFDGGGDGMLSLLFDRENRIQAYSDSLLYSLSCFLSDAPWSPAHSQNTCPQLSRRLVDGTSTSFR